MPSADQLMSKIYSPKNVDLALTVIDHELSKLPDTKLLYGLLYLFAKELTKFENAIAEQLGL